MDPERILSKAAAKTNSALLGESLVVHTYFFATTCMFVCFPLLKRYNPNHRKQLSGQPKPSSVAKCTPEKTSSNTWIENASPL
jgi:hypothetical protein